MYREGSIEDGTLVLVYNAAEQYEAELARDVLAQEGIPVVLADREDSGAYLRVLGMGSPFGMDVLVHRDHEARARKILEETFSEQKGISEEELAELALQAQEESDEA